MKKIVMSDLHLGLDGSDGITRSLLAKPLPGKGPDPAAENLRNFVMTFAGSETIGMIGVGDVADMAMAATEDIARDFEYLFTEILPMVKTLEIVMGNHDTELYYAQRLRFPDFAPAPSPCIQLPQAFGDLFAKLGIDAVVKSPDMTTVTKSGEKVYFVHGHFWDTSDNFLAQALLPSTVTGRDYVNAAAALCSPLDLLVYWGLGEMGCGYGKEGLLTEFYNDVHLGKQSKVHDMLKQWIHNYKPDLNTFIVDILADILTDVASNTIGKAQLGVSDQRHADFNISRVKVKAWLDRIGHDYSHRSTVFTGHTHVADLYVLGGNTNSANTGCGGTTSCFNLGSWLSEPGHAVPDAMVAFVDDELDPFMVRWEKCTG